MSEQLLDTPAKYAFSVTAILDRSWNSLVERAFRTGWGPISRLAETAVVALMQKISVGQLRVLTFSRIYTFPAPNEDSTNTRPDLKAELRVVNDAFWIRLCTMGDLGFAEAYMYGDVVCDDLVTLFNIFLLNRENLSNLGSSVSYLFTLPQKLTSYRFLNTIGNSHSNISAHYDISNDMFAGFLSQDMTYSCAIFETLDGDLEGGSVNRGEWSGGQGLKRLGQNASIHRSSVASGAGTNTKDGLHEGQLRKLKHIIHKARISPGHRVLEIGSGWGSMAIQIASTIPDTLVDTLTLSVQQQALAIERVKAAGLEDRITIQLMDYRNMPAEWEGVFDRLISIEMIEAVGQEFLDKYWSTVNWALKRVGGAGVVQVITLPEPRFERYTQEIDFIRKWIFPGGFLPTLTLLLQSLQKGSSGRLIVDSVSNIGPHYSRTLREWRKRFLDCFDSVILPALMREYPEVMAGHSGRDEIEVFKRKWICNADYYCYCEVGFTTRTLGDHVVTFTREGYQEFSCNVYE